MLRVPARLVVPTKYVSSVVASTNIANVAQRNAKGSISPSIPPRRTQHSGSHARRLASTAMPVATTSHAAAAAVPAADNAGGSDRINLSLDRIRALLHQLGNPHHAFPIIHVAGTNAKGSTIAYLDAILRDVVGVRTGSFTTPHLITQRDSCRTNGEPIDEAAWAVAGDKIQEASSVASVQCTPFEELTARSFVAFSLLPPEVRPQILLIEVGMGGTLDATNVFRDRQVLASVIGAIDYDHQSFLGDTLGEIASHKAGIVKAKGLCILADQRRTEADQYGEHQVLRVDVAAAHTALNAAQEITEAVRAECADCEARFVLNTVPWQSLDQVYARASPTQGLQPGPVYTRSFARFSPILAQSKARAGAYVASTGDVVVPGPDAQLPATRASLMGAHLAMQTLWSIARDETPSGLGMDGSDEHEELKLAIAFALRDDETAHALLKTCVERVQLAGRAEWQSVALPPPIDGEGGTEGPGEHDVAKVLIDGAHNASAALALGQYVRACMSAQASSPAATSTVTWILAFSQGKDVTSILANLLCVGDDIAQDLQNMNLDGAAGMATEGASGARPQLRHRVAVVPFSTPVEGMPWVRPADLSEVSQAVQVLKAEHPGLITESASFPAEPANELPLVRALRWAKSQDHVESSLNVIAGSLYLVSDAHRLIQSAA